MAVRIGNSPLKPGDQPKLTVGQRVQHRVSGAIYIWKGDMVQAHKFIAAPDEPVSKPKRKRAPKTVVEETPTSILDELNAEQHG